MGYFNVTFVQEGCDESTINARCSIQTLTVHQPTIQLAEMYCLVLFSVYVFMAYRAVTQTPRTFVKVLV